eukprot:7567840-Pyramimonas_sp.AAC.1
MVGGRECEGSWGEDPPPASTRASSSRCHPPPASGASVACDAPGVPAPQAAAQEPVDGGDDVGKVADDGLSQEAEARAARAKAEEAAREAAEAAAYADLPDRQPSIAPS